MDIGAIVVSIIPSVYRWVRKRLTPALEVKPETYSIKRNSLSINGRLINNTDYDMIFEKIYLKDRDGSMYKNRLGEGGIRAHGGYQFTFEFGLPKHHKCTLIIVTTTQKKYKKKIDLKKLRKIG